MASLSISSKGAVNIRILHNPARPNNGATIAQVSYSAGGKFGAVSSAEARDVSIFAPRGMSYLPCEGDRLLMLNVDGIDVCVGVISQSGDMAAGEIKLASSGGASIHLKNNGDISLNGVTITRDGIILNENGG